MYLIIKRNQINNYVLFFQYRVPIYTKVDCGSNNLYEQVWSARKNYLKIFMQLDINYINADIL